MSSIKARWYCLFRLESVLEGQSSTCVLYAIGTEYGNLGYLFVVEGSVAEATWNFLGSMPLAGDLRATGKISQPLERLDYTHCTDDNEGRQ